MSMFCYQCEQTKDGTGCTEFGVCGKDPRTAAFQDLLIHVCKGVAVVADRIRSSVTPDILRNADRFIAEGLFTTITNVNFDPARLEEIIRRGIVIRDRLIAQGAETNGEPLEATPSATWTPAPDSDGLLAQGYALAIDRRQDSLGEDVVGLQELLLYGLKGAAAYVDHAMILGHEDPAVWAFLSEALAFLAEDPAEIDRLLSMCLRCGEVNLRVMELLDEANTGAYGDPVPTDVRIDPVAGKAILVSGHDLKDLGELLKQTEGTGIQVYTHGEMLPAHGYPGLNRYPHLAGNYGGAWQDQQKEFAAFPGSILMTTNCIQKPASSYSNRIFTSGLVAWPGVSHIADRDFSPVIETALRADGFVEDGPGRTIKVGFAHNAVLGVAGDVIDAVKSGAIRHFFLVGGCDGAKPGRNYYTEFAQAVPDDCMILTLACGKYRFNKLDFGTIGGIPRLLDIGQCNDAYSAVRIAQALADAFETDVNSLPLSFVLSWYEQKAVVILLSLLHLGIRGIRIGPTLPAFLTTAVLDVLVKNFELTPITSPENDLRTLLGES